MSVYDTDLFLFDLDFAVLLSCFAFVYWFTVIEFIIPQAQ